MTASKVQVHVVAAVNITKRSATISSVLPLSTWADSRHLSGVRRL
jgi:hypothetical protein